MLILAVIYLLYTVYGAVRFIIGFKDKKETRRSEVIDLLCDLCLGVFLLIEALSLKGVIGYNVFISAVPIALYVIGKLYKNHIG